MIPAPFDYEVADSVDHAVELLGSGKDAKLLAGGHSLLPLMRLRLARPELLVDIGRVSDLSYVREEGDAIAIGALTRYRDLEQSELLHAECPILASMAGLVGDPQVRHRGTIGGSVAHCDPASMPPRCCLGSTPSSWCAVPAASGGCRSREARRVPADRARSAGGADGDPRSQDRGRQLGVRRIPTGGPRTGRL